MDLSHTCEKKRIIGIDELRGDAQRGACSPYAPLECIPHLQLLSDRRNRLRRTLERHSRGARYDSEGPHPRQVRYQLLGQPIRKELIIRIGTQILERVEPDLSCVVRVLPVRRAQ